MKRNRLKGTTNHTLTQKREALKELKTLQAKGLSLNQSRIQVGAKYNMTPSGIAYWERTVGKNKTKKAVKVTKTTHTTNNRNYTFNDLSNGVRGIAMSIINKDGRYSVKEAHAVGKLYSSELHHAKLQIEVHKMNEKSKSSNALRIS